MLKNLWKKTKHKEPQTIDPTNIPDHIAIIMDGNGRWAKRRGMPRSMGHRAGAEVLKEIVKAAQGFGVKALTVYGFSTENWKRPEEEVSLLMALIKEYLLSNVKRMHAEGVRIRFIGDISKLSSELQDIIHESEALTANNKGITLQLAINYGGRDELTRAMKRITQDIAKGKLSEDDINEVLISSYLDTQEFDRVDLLIRPSNDARISNFLLWQLAYAEFWFTPLHWPDFTPAVLEEAIYAYQQRERRFGGLKEEK